MKNIIQNIKENYRLVIGVLIVGILIGWIFFHSSGEMVSQETHIEGHEGHNHESEDPTTWTCSMHPQIKQDKPGKCPICAMDLIPLTIISSGGDDVDPNEIVMTESAIKLASIQTMIAKKGIPSKTIYLQGKIHVDERNIAELTARFGGRIEKLFVNFTGQNVSKGEKLATIYSPGLVAAQRELLEAISLKESRPSLYTAAKGKLKLWDLSDKQIAEIEEKGEPQIYFDVLSPISGTVMMRHVAIGDYIKEGSALFKVVDLTKVWAMFDAYESDLPWIKISDKIDFTIQALPGKNFSAKVSYIDPFINGKTRVASIRVDIQNPKLTLKPEMFTTGILESKIAESSNEILVPKSSVLWTGKRSVVYVKVPNRETPSFLYREIVLGPEAGLFFVVKEGLNEGEEIATNGVFKIDASAQLIGLPSMMNPDGGKVSTGHNHGNTNSKQDHSTHSQISENLERTMFEVGGACEMCKARIEETALSINGVEHAKWSTEDHILHLSFDSKKVKITDIHKAIAKAGHDTELEKASDDIYNELPGCCLYERLTYGKVKSSAESSEFFVNGACGMCKERIEKAALSVNGVQSAEWNEESKIIQVSYNSKIKLMEIHQAIAKVGHDTKMVKANDDVYNALPECCKYERKLK
ncbi:MAG: efflux RND transporter periplasmic adaptor subunit [Bacteroidales bacterium]|nr:efflux RND transporter periplasmic adaptor subunit [Bacteroidales bacterium]